LLIPHLRDVVFRTRGKTYWSYLSPAWETLTGFTVEESLGRSIMDFVYPDDRQENTSVKQQLESGKTDASRHVKRLVRRDGSFVWIEADVRVVYDTSGEFQGSVGTLRDITDRVQLQAALDKERQLARTTLAALSDGVLTLDANLRIEFLNAAAITLCGVSESGVLGRLVQDVLCLEEGDLLLAIAESMAANTVRGLAGQSRLQRADGQLLDVDLTVIPVPWNECGCVVVLRDVREQRAVQAKLAYQATHDLLTQLNNRAAMQAELDKRHADALSHDAPYTVLLVDIDHFKGVNDHYGHAIGDDVLRSTATAMRSVLRDGDILARWGGEEFLCLLPNTGGDEGTEIAERVRIAVANIQLSYSGRPVELTISIGVSGLKAGGADSVQDMLLRADAALYEAKQAGRNRVCRDGQDVIGMAGRVLRALKEDGFGFALQPLVDLATRQTVGYEAFARMIDAHQGRVFEAERFVPVARQLNVLHQVDSILIPRIFHRVSTLGGHPASPLCFVNISADLLRRPDQLQHLLTLLRREACDRMTDPDSTPLLVLDLNEREFLQDVAGAKALLAPLFALGVELAIDHFSTGFASLDYLSDLPVRYLKFESRFLRKAERDPRARTVLRSLCRLAGDLGCRTVAIHIEDAGTAGLARDLGIDWGQGHHFGSPLVQDVESRVS
jgi:diguanylate cyclase (GGDEF)-like protein/PAS domain S-box-containing protein